MVNEKSINNRYYWHCELKDAKNCKGRAITILEGEEYVLKKFVKHSHAPEASCANVIQTLNMIKEAASNTNDHPVRLIQSTVTSMQQDSYYYMPNNEALRKQIQRVRNVNMPPQPQSLQEINIPIHLCTTISGEQFLAKEIEIGEEKMMIFCTPSNLLHLQEADYWIMDGTFRTVPTLFQQLYTIHALVNKGNNSRVFPMVYVLMTSKSEEMYRALFEELIELGDQAGQDLSPPLIITDFEQAAIKAAREEFPDSSNKGCFFHLCQNIWKKIQSENLVNEYYI